MSETYTIVVKAEGFQKDLARVEKKLRTAAAVAAVESGGRQIVNFAKLNVQRVFNHHQGGDAGINGTWTVEAKAIGKGAEATIAPHTAYTRIQELGGTIEPVHAKRLAWRDPDTGKWCFAKKVTLPPRPYLRPAVEDHMTEIRDAMLSAIDSFI